VNNPKLKTYRVSWTGGRPVGSIRPPGNPYEGGGSMIVEAVSPAAAHHEVLEKHYEHIYTVKVVEVES
jgi:hypothetical protein